ncbi:uncharacterized protein BXZ73DRAFT_76013 [Epithele typhae]|uniref:uncharacterized protein n=1 Tax=Epithele typhae TaxID=378194 RepID=UPI0020075B27|nr:uncharacterized protein BXZ73DRAFT_76013 [Epithele typhae]KAH9939296.1 hypothetical protein BXZ73DRAFT_76013 [Epithele typhae]
MESLPTEILHVIFKLACTDGGPTGVRLALVSKHFRVVARAVRFHSVALRDRASVDIFHRAFVQEIKEAQQGSENPCTPIVQHLFVAERATQRSPIKKVLTLAAPTLETLALAAHNIPLSLLFSVAPTLPALRELTVLGHTPKYFSELPPGKCVRVLPALKMLHLILEDFTTSSKPTTISSDLKRWSCAAPKLHGVRLSRAPQAATLSWLSAMLVPKREDRPSPSVRAIALEVVAHRRGEPDQLPEIEACEGKTPAEIALCVTRPRKSYGACPALETKLESEWTDRVEGWDGGWPRVVLI